MAMDPVTAAKVTGTVVKNRDKIFKTLVAIILSICAGLTMLSSVTVYLLAAPMEELQKYFKTPLQYAALVAFRTVYGHIITDYSGSFDNSFSGDYPFPVPVWRITSDYGWRIHPTKGFRDFHNGLDIATAHHTPIKAIDNGSVAVIGLDKFFGRYVMLQHERTVITGYEKIPKDDPEYDENAPTKKRPKKEKETFYSFYGHLAKVNVICTGQEVKKGVSIGLVGGDPKKDAFPGESTGAHLHFGIYHGLNIFNDAVDPRPYMTNQKQKKEESA